MPSVRSWEAVGDGAKNFVPAAGLRQRPYANSRSRTDQRAPPIRYYVGLPLIMTENGRKKMLHHPVLGLVAVGGGKRIEKREKSKV